MEQNLTLEMDENFNNSNRQLNITYEQFLSAKYNYLANSS